MSSRQSRGVAARVCRALLGLAFALPLVAAGPTRAAVAVICVPTTCDVSCTATAATIQLGIDAASAKLHQALTDYLTEHQPDQAG